ncbi:hypothetical protein EBT31_06775 [bacterium]|nr:hypothetical protein [bacterium]NBX48810.1 hypothetical protein [bacterium]
MYKKLTHTEHILKRPDSYVGSVVPETETLWVVSDGDHFTQKSVTFSQGLLKIFDEILVNAIDQNTLHPKEVRRIDVTLSSASITVKNNGVAIPIERHAETGVWVPELIFGHLLTSSNYDDNVERVTGGRNGYGAKLTNIFSKWFEVEVTDGAQSYLQTWRNNMSVCDSPVISKSKAKPSVQIKFLPDYDKFGVTYDQVKKLFEKRVYDAAMWCSCKVYLNDTHIEMKDLHEYAEMYIENPECWAKHKQDNWEVVATYSDSYQQISFVNGVCTTKGGSHVDHVMSQIVNEVRKKCKNATPTQIRNGIFLFVKSTLVNPTFSSQAKTECTSRISKPVEFKPKFIKDLLASGLEAHLEAMQDVKLKKELKKTDGAKKSRITGIPKLDDANWAGTSKSDQCTLIITEGDSAKSLAVAGLSIVGRDKYGVFPLRGKPKNVRDATVKQLTDNQEFSHLKQILGLQHGRVYSSTKDLRYGRLMIMTDADLDGSHIKGLVLNMIHCFWPSLMKLGFVCSMVTPIIKAGSQWFFTEEDFRKASVSGHVKYYKGLGTSTSAEAKEYFRQIDRLTVAFKYDESTDENMKLAFAKEEADSRKEWLLGHMETPAQIVPYGKITHLSVTDFVQRDLVNFSAEDIHRSIPHVMDGLKPSQRKVIYACLKKNLGTDMKVAQLSGYVAEQTQYHHGEASLQGTIIGLAQNFVGSNNLNLLEPSGQFGTRLMGGKDAASPRYIFTRLNPATRKIFDPRDDPVLEYVIEDGEKVEPEFYVPILPMVLVNGAEGIGTGFSCSVPPYNPVNIKANLLRMIQGEAPVDMQPYWRGFNGPVERTGPSTWTAKAVYTKSGDVLHVTELPPGVWIQEFKEKLDKLEVRYENQSTETRVDFKVWGAKENQLPLSKTFHTSNMYLIHNGTPKKYSSVTDILMDFFMIRYNYLKKRKAHILEMLTRKLKLLSERERFVRLVVSGKLVVFKKPKAVLEKELSDLQFTELETLLNIRTYEYTQESIEKLVNEAQKTRTELVTMKTKPVSDMWKENLAAF